MSSTLFMPLFALLLLFKSPVQGGQILTFNSCRGK